MRRYEDMLISTYTIYYTYYVYVKCLIFYCIVSCKFEYIVVGNACVLPILIYLRTLNVQNTTLQGVVEWAYVNNISSYRNNFFKILDVQTGAYVNSIGYI